MKSGENVSNVCNNSRLSLMFQHYSLCIMSILNFLYDSLPIPALSWEITDQIERKIKTSSSAAVYVLMISS